MNELALFAGAGGGILGGHLLGWKTVCAVEIDHYARRVLLARQRDGMLPRFPIWDDVTTFDGRPWRGRVDVVSGGFPCQDISAAGKGAGLAGSRSGLWSEFARIIGEVQPRHVFVENSPVLTSRGLGVVLGDLASLGYDAWWGVVSAFDVGAPHLRERIWIVANACCGRCGGARKWKNKQPGRAEVVGAGEDVSNAECDRCGQVEQSEPGRTHGEGSTGTSWPSTGGWWESEPDVGRVAHGVASRVDRLKCLGNGQVPAVAARAWRLLGNEGVV